MNINEAAQICGVSDKTIRRAIKQKKLHATYPQPNRAEIAQNELERYMSGQKSKFAMTGQVSTQESGQSSRQKPDVKTDKRIHDLEARVRLLEEQVTSLMSQVKPAKKLTRLPGQLISLKRFASVHQVSEVETDRAINMSVLPVKKGSWKDDDGKPFDTALDARGRRAFYEAFSNSVPMWRSCPNCPHIV